MTNPIITKTCVICNTPKDLTQFTFIDKSHKYQDSRCRQCFRELRKNAAINLSDIVISRFFTKVLKTDTCWVWQGGVDGNKYGKFYLGYKTILAHRFSAMLVTGPEYLANKDVLHTCDNPPCVNPNHFQYGNQAQNIADMVSKCRQARGEKHSQSKLSEADIETIRIRLSNGEKQVKISRDMGINQSVVSRIKTGKAWSHTA